RRPGTARERPPPGATETDDGCRGSGCQEYRTILVASGTAALLCPPSKTTVSLWTETRIRAVGPGLSRSVHTTGADNSSRPPAVVQDATTSFLPGVSGTVARNVVPEAWTGTVSDPLTLIVTPEHRAVPRTSSFQAKASPPRV